MFPSQLCIHGGSDTNLVLSAAILASRIAAGRPEWDVLRQPSPRCYSHPSGERLQTSPHLSSSCLPSNTVSSCLFLHSLALRPLCPSTFFSFASFSSFFLFLPSCSQWLIVSQRFKLRKGKANPLNVQSNSRQIESQLVQTKTSPGGRAVKGSDAKQQKNESFCISVQEQVGQVERETFPPCLPQR